jgi:hypothetical protein
VGERLSPDARRDALAGLTRSQALVRTIGARTDTVELSGTSAFVFLSHEREVMQAIDRFMGALAR